MLEKFSWKFQYEYPLNHLYIIFRLLGISAYKKNKNRFKVCHLTRLLSIPVLLLMATCHYFVVAVLFQVYKGYLNIPIGIAFLSYGIGCIASYVNLVIKNNKICELMNEITEMKKILEAKNPDYKFGTSISAFTFFWLGFSFIVAFNVHDSLVETSKYKFNQFWIQMAVDFILVMIFIMDAHFVAVAVTVRDLFKCFRHIFKVNTLKKDFNVRDFETRQVTKAINLLRFCKHNHKVLHGMREQVNKNFGIVNFSSVTYTLILLIYVAYSNVKRYKHDPYESVKEAAFYIIHYGGKLLALLRFCAKVNEEDYKLFKQMHMYFLNYEDSNIQEEVQIFSLQIIHHRFQFDANGFFDMNFTLALQITSVVATYAIILIQLQIAQDSCQCLA